MQTTISIDYSKKKRQTRLVRGLPRIDVHYLARCTCGHEWYIRHDAIKRTHSCFNCSQLAKAKKGYAATASKYGERFALRWWREWRLENPTCLERTVINWLDAFGVPYEREYWFVSDSDSSVYLLDFLINSQLVIEVNGAYWHEMPHIVARDAQKADALHYAGFDLLVMSEDDVTSGRGYAQIQALLAPTTAL